EARRLSYELAISLKSPLPMSLQDATRLVRIVSAIPLDINLLPRWFDPDVRETVGEFAFETASRAVGLKELADSLFVAHSPGILELDLDAAIDAFNEGLITRIFSGRYREARRQVRETAQSNLHQSRDV